MGGGGGGRIIVMHEPCSLFFSSLNFSSQGLGPRNTFLTLEFMYSVTSCIFEFHLKSQFLNFI